MSQDSKTGSWYITVKTASRFYARRRYGHLQPFAKKIQITVHVLYLALLALHPFCLELFKSNKLTALFSPTKSCIVHAMCLIQQSATIQIQFPNQKTTQNYEFSFRDEKLSKTTSM
jgi:hypothetical protein